MFNLTEEEENQYTASHLSQSASPVLPRKINLSILFEPLTTAVSPSPHIFYPISIYYEQNTALSKNILAQLFPNERHINANSLCISVYYYVMQKIYCAATLYNAVSCIVNKCIVLNVCLYNAELYVLYIVVLCSMYSCTMMS